MSTQVVYSNPRQPIAAKYKWSWNDAWFLFNFFFIIIFVSADAKPVQEITGSLSVFQSTWVQCKFLFFFFNNNYSACISYSVTEKESHDIVRWYWWGKSLKSRSTFQKSMNFFVAPFVAEKCFNLWKDTIQKLTETNQNYWPTHRNLYIATDRGAQFW